LIHPKFRNGLQNQHVTLLVGESSVVVVPLGTRIKLDIPANHLLSASKRLSGIPDFWLYAIADGIREVCARARS
jgi:hypothetical protein